MIENPANGKSTITNLSGVLEISIPSNKNWFALIFMCIWLGGWAVGEYFAITQLLKSDTPMGVNLFLLVWVIGWTVGGVFVFYTVLWQLFGIETITIERGLLTLNKTALTIGKQKQYRISNIKNLGINHTYSATVFKMNSRNSEKNYTGNMNQGKIQFDYGMKTIKFGQSIEEAEARHIITLFKENRHFSEENFVPE